MPKFLECREKKAAAYLRATVILIAVMLLFVILLGNDPEIGSASLVFVIVFGAPAVFTFWKYRSKKRNRNNYEWFLKYGNDSMLADVDSYLQANPKAHLVLGKDVAVYTDGIDCFIIPYSQVGMVSYDDAVGDDCLPRADFWMKDNHHIFVGDIDEQTLMEIVQKYILPKSPNVIVGDGKKEQIKKFKEMYGK